MKHTKTLMKMAICCLLATIVYQTKQERIPVQSAPIQTIALAAIDVPIQDGLKTKLFTVIDKPENIGQTTP